MVTYTILMSASTDEALRVAMNMAIYSEALNGTLGNYTVDQCSFLLGGKETFFWSYFVC